MFLAIVIYTPPGYSQSGGVGNYIGDESAFYASTKQINQFFRRFNSEEDEEGNRIYKDSKKFRNPKLRKQFLEILFDNETSELDEALRAIFIDEVTNNEEPVYLNFHGGEWFSEVHTTFKYHGKESNCILYMRLQEENVGSKWVIDRVYFNPFDQFFKRDAPVEDGKFLHPLSHELDFMNLNKIFQQPREVSLYTSRDFKPNHLTMMLMEVERGNMTFVSIKNVKFHFFQIDNWYFELSEFNRSGYNTGWLISNLSKLTEEQKNSYKKFIYFEN